MGLPHIELQLMAGTQPVQDEAQAEHSAPQPPPVPMLETTNPAPVEKGITDEDLTRLRRLVLKRIDWMLPLADEIVADRLKLGGVSDTERLCLMRVRDIISYGLLRHSLGELEKGKELAKQYLILRDEHRQAIRSEKFLRQLTISPTKTNPREAFKDTLKEHKRTRQDACKIFDNWSRMMDEAYRTARQNRGHSSRILQQAILQASPIDILTNQLQSSDSSVGKGSAMPASADVGGMLYK